MIASGGEPNNVAEHAKMQFKQLVHFLRLRGFVKEGIYLMFIRAIEEVVLEEYLDKSRREDGTSSKLD